jgi:phosphoglycerol geranylgeranyltransferase
MPTPGKVEKYLIERSKKGTILAALIDPEDFTPAQAARTAASAEKAGASLVLVGGSTISNQVKLDAVVRSVRRSVTSHVVLFPGNITGVSRHADAILFSSLLNSTNPYFIIGAQALGAMEVYKSKLESIPMGYLVFGDNSATSFVGQVNSVPLSKPNLAAIYALAAQYLGMRSLYLEAGSGSDVPLPSETIKLVRRFYEGILIVGGGITSPESARRISRAGADVIVIGNLLQTPSFEPKLEKITASLRTRVSNPKSRSGRLNPKTR